jgi:hypothetical protein
MAARLLAPGALAALLAAAPAPAAVPPAAAGDPADRDPSGSEPPAAPAGPALPIAAPAAAERPSDEELFGGPAPGEPGQPGARGDDEATLFGVPPDARPPPPEGTVSREREDPLRIGGQVYLQFQVYAEEDVGSDDWPVASPNIVDVFLDVRPNDRVRTFALGRLAYDPAVPDRTAGVPAEVVSALGLEPPASSRAALDQRWVNFDVARTVFVTAGKQHVKWGVGRFWNPTDFLHRQPRDPLDVFDARTGTGMVKAHLPWEGRGWNAYAVALLEDPRVGSRAAPATVAGLLAGGRLEVVLGTVELGADVLAGDGARPRWGLDASAGVWELDLHAEAALGAARPRWRVRDPAAPVLAEPGQGRYALETPAGASPQVVAGASWAANYSDEDAVAVGAEWFYQEAGYAERDVYPFLYFGAPALTAPPTDPDVSLAQQEPAAFTSFYLGKHYAGAWVSLPAPGSWNDTTFTLSVLGNLSDRSFVARLDHALVALTYLRVETFVAGHFGQRGGEFRLELPLPPELAAVAPPGLLPGTPVVDVGIALRVSL